MYVKGRENSITRVWVFKHFQQSEGIGFDHQSQSNAVYACWRSVRCYD